MAAEEKAPDATPKPNPRRPGWRVVDALDAFLDASADVLGASASQYEDDYRARVAERAYAARLALADALEALVAETPIRVRTVFDMCFPEGGGATPIAERGRDPRE